MEVWLAEGVTYGWPLLALGDSVATTWVCDWTHWQGMPVPAKQIADEGFGMVKLKAGGAKSARHFEDPMFSQSAMLLLDEPRLIPAAYWYLMPGSPVAQAGHFYDLLVKHGNTHPWGAFLDLEEPGISPVEIGAFAWAWSVLTNGQPLAVYTSKRYWEGLQASQTNWGAGIFPVLEEARWVPQSVRESPQTKYASQQAKAIEPQWWEISYGGWNGPTLIQFTDYALVAGKRVTASIYRGTKESLRGLVVRSS